MADFAGLAWFDLEAKWPRLASVRTDIPLEPSFADYKFLL